MSLKKCFIMLSLNTTQQEAIDRGLFGEIGRSFMHIQEIEPGDIGFLFNLDSDALIGPFEASSKPGMNLVPEAWDGKYPSQVHVKPIGYLKRIDDASRVLNSLDIETDEFRYDVRVPRFPVHSWDKAEKLLAIIQSRGTRITQADSGSSKKDTENEEIERLQGRIPKGLEKILHGVAEKERKRAVKELRDNLGVSSELSEQEIRLLVLGPAGVEPNILYAIAKNLGLEKDQLELRLDYDKNKRFDVTSLKFSRRYSGILIGPIAHKIVGLGDYNGLIQKLRQEEGYPIFEELKEKEGELKITKTSFKNSLQKILDRLGRQIANQLWPDQAPVK